MYTFSTAVTSAILVTALATVRVSGAQAPATAKQVMPPRVPVRVFVSLADSTTRFYPVRGHRLVFYRSATDSVSVTTDSLGSVTVALAPGDYRLVSGENFPWHGAEYSWNVPITIRAGMPIIDLRGPDAEGHARSSSTASEPATFVQEGRATPAPAEMPTAASTQPRHGYVQTRDGFWFTLGMGVGSLGCSDCGDRTNGLSGGLGLGGTVSPHVLLGAFTSGWYKSEDGVTVTAGVVVAGIRYYPSVSNGFFMLAGLGVGQLGASADGLGTATTTGSGAILGLGWDIRIAPNASLTPFWNGIGINVSDGDANYGQIGVGFTIH